ncbi:hypothetical protein [Serratia fonticola]|uniref:hypothetical protein n=1 Tax=Serratia fonticola TaxID=47917 RepID=UPI000684C9BD|nr:hypothetical protein [Serratia fonticola]
MRTLRGCYQWFLLLALLASTALWAAEAVAPWPHRVTLSGTSMELHQPQLDSWQDNLLKGRMVVAVKTGTLTDAKGKNRTKSATASPGSAPALAPTRNSGRSRWIISKLKR